MKIDIHAHAVDRKYADALRQPTRPRIHRPEARGADYTISSVAFTIANGGISSGMKVFVAGVGAVVYSARPSKR